MRAALARALGRHLVRVMPASRADWAAGMNAEIDAIKDPTAALAFALGCVRVGYGRRLRTISGTLTAMRWVIGLVTIAYAILILANAHWLLSLESSGTLPYILGGLGLAFMIAAVTLIWRGPLALALVALIMLVLNTCALLATGKPDILHVYVHQALIMEGYILWSLLLLAGLTLHHATRSTLLVRMARDHGWNG